MSKKSFGKLTYKMLTMTILPLVILGIIIIFFTSRWFHQAMNDEVQTELRSVARAVLNTYDLLYPGDYGRLAADQFILTKGEYILNDANAPLDYIKETTDVDVSIFYWNTRFLTTLRGDNGERLVGTHCNQIVAAEVLDEGSERFYNSVTAGSREYFAYYYPIHNSDGTLIGMIATLKPSAEVQALIRRSIFPILIVLFMVTALIGIITTRFTNGLIDAIHKQQDILRHIAGGELNYSINSELLGREDEFGDMARSTGIMQQSLRDLIEIDYLTGLDNRRSGQNILKKVYELSKESGTEFTIAIADIDHFKRFNDTYGHDCGDLVLREIACELKKGMVGKGYAVRWGGEEFLFIFDSTTYEQSLTAVSSIADSVRACTIEYGGEQLGVTLTIGVVLGDHSYSIDELIKQADDLLYKGKMDGRNRIVTQNSQ